MTTTTGVAADVIGKPNPPLFTMARERAGGGRPLCVGDRLDTDVAGAAALGWDSVLVLSGVARREDVASAPSAPTHVVDSIGELASDA